MIKNVEKLLFHATALVAVVIFAFYLARLAQGSSFIRELVAGYGYLGVFIASFAGGFNLFVPVPVAAFFPFFLEAGYHFWPTIFTIALGVTLADSLAYLIGKLGHRIAMHAGKKKILWEIELLRSRWKWAPFAIFFLFVVFVPFPNEIILVPLGFLGYRFMYLFPIILVGNFAFNLLYATGAVGLFRALL